MELDRCLFNSSQDKTDTYIIGGFLPHLAVPRFLTQPVGGFINNILRGLLRINYELCTYNAALHRTPLSKGVGDAGAGRGGQILRPTSLRRSRRQIPPNHCAGHLARRWRRQELSTGSTNSLWLRRKTTLGTGSVVRDQVKNTAATLYAASTGLAVWDPTCSAGEEYYSCACVHWSSD